MTNDANLALRLALARNRAERRAAVRLARHTAAASARRLALARRLFGSTSIADVERIDALEPAQAAVVDLIVSEPPAYSLYLASGQEQRDPVASPRLTDVHRSIAAPRPGPRAGTALAAA